MEYKYFNPNPTASTFKSGKPKGWIKDDSIIRAICAATGNSWETIFDELVKIARKNHDVITSKNVIDDYCILNGFEYVTYGKPTPGSKRPSIEEFLKANPTGTFIIYFANYYVCIKDGVYYDVKDQPKGSVYSFWKKKD